MRNTKIETSLTANFGKRKAIKFQASNNNFIELYNTVGTTKDTASNPLDLTYYFSVPEISAPSEYQQLFYCDDSGTRHVHVRLFARSISLSVENDDGSTVYFSNVSSDILPATVNIFNKFQIMVSGRSIFIWLNNVLIQENINILGSGDSFIYDVLRLGYSVFAAAPQYYFNEGFILADLNGTYTFKDFYKNTTDLSLYGDYVYKISDLISSDFIYVFGHGGAALTALNRTQEFDVETLHDSSDPLIPKVLFSASPINVERVDREGNIVAVDSQFTLHRTEKTEFLKEEAFELQVYSDKVTASGTTIQLSFSFPVNFVELNLLSFSDGASVKFYKGDITDSFDWGSITESAVTGIKSFYFTDQQNIITIRINGTIEFEVKELSHRFFRLNYDEKTYLMYSQFPTDLTEVTKKDLVIDLFGFDGLIKRRLTGIDVRNIGIPIYDLDLTSFTREANHAYTFPNSPILSVLWWNPTKFVKLNELINRLLKSSGFDFFIFSDLQDVYYRLALYAAKDKNGDYLTTGNGYEGDDPGDPDHPDLSSIFNNTILPNLATYDAGEFFEFIMNALGGIYYFDLNNLVLVLQNDSLSELDKKLLLNTKTIKSVDAKTHYEIENELNIFSSTFANLESDMKFDGYDEGDPLFTEIDMQSTDFYMYHLYLGHPSAANFYVGVNQIHFPIIIDRNRSGYAPDSTAPPWSTGDISYIPKSCWAAIDKLEDDAKENGLSHLFLQEDESKASGFKQFEIYSSKFLKSIRIVRRSFELSAMINSTELEINKKVTIDGIDWIIYRQTIPHSIKGSERNKSTIYALPINET